MTVAAARALLPKLSPPRILKTSSEAAARHRDPPLATEGSVSPSSCGSLTKTSGGVEG